MLWIFRLIHWYDGFESLCVINDFINHLNTMRQYRQGDVLLIEVQELQIEGYSLSNSKTVALGEATGHHHTFDGDVSVYEKQEESNMAINDKGMLVDVLNDSVLTHQEHAPIAVPKGKYKRIIQREYSPEAIRNVMD